MIPRNTADVSVLESNIDGESIEMTIDEESLSHIMSVLTDLYSDTMMAVIREYSTNARDAHLEFGKVNLPIEVHTPSTFSPVFRVRDYGSGLSLEDIRNVYSKYGASTKRNSDVSNGMLGLGAKSALTYTSSFTVLSVKNGMKHIVSVGRRENGGGYMEVMDSVPSSDPSGVEIQVPVPARDASTFTEKVKRFFQFWEYGTVKIDGEVHQGVSLEAFTKVDSRTYFTANGYISGVEANMIVMGGVAYPAPFPSAFPYAHRSRFVYFADMGEAIFSPSRESLLTNNQNRALFDRIVQNIKDNSLEAAERIINDCETKLDAVLASKAVCDNLIYPFTGRSTDKWNIKYKGVSLADYWTQVETVINTDASLRYGNTRHYGDPTEFYGQTRYQNLNREAIFSAAVIVSGVDPERVDSASRRRTILRGLRALGHEGVYVILTETDGSEIHNVLCKKVPVITSDEVSEAYREDLKNSRSNAPVKKKANAASGTIDKIASTYDGIMNTVITSYSGDGKDLVFLARQELRDNAGVVPGYNLYNRSNSLKLSIEKHPDLTFVAVTQKDQAKFKALFPKAVHFKDFRKNLSESLFLDALMNASKGGFTKEDVITWAIEKYDVYNNGYSDYGMVTRLAPNVRSKAFSNFAMKIAAHQKIDKAYDSICRVYDPMFDEYAFRNYAKGLDPTMIGARTAYREIISRYPLIGTSRYDRATAEVINHMAQYVNAVDSGVIA